MRRMDYLLKRHVLLKHRDLLLRELLVRLVKAMCGFNIALIVSLFLGKPVLQMIAEPVERQLQAAQEERAAARARSLEFHPPADDSRSPEQP